MTLDETRHLCRRLVFATTPGMEAAVRGRSPEEAVAALFAQARRLPPPRPPETVREVWTNVALRLPGMSDRQYDLLRAPQVLSNRRDIELVRQWWLGEMIDGLAPLRENLTLFFEGTFGSSTEVMDVPHAIYQRNALIRRLCLGTVPELLEALVLDPAMMVQIGMDEHFKARVSDRPAKLILDYWTVGTGAYSDGDVDNLSRALTGWRLAAAPGREPAIPPDADAVLAARRTGLTATLVPAQFDARPKTILGMTSNFDARSALRFLSRHPATARRFGQRLLQYVGVEEPEEQLQSRLAETYRATDGSIEAMLRVIVRSDAFWSSASRWSLVKSPVQMAVGACRQLELESPPLVEISRWLTATGQTLFDTPNGGEGGWPGQVAWMMPPERLLVRYQLPVVLSGRTPPLGLRASEADAKAPPLRLPLGATLGRASGNALIERLDPAPGLDASKITRAAASSGSSDRSDLVRRVMMTPEYQFA